MTTRAFTGGAGCGKTYQLIQALRGRLADAPLSEGQKVLALTFMHGSRRRLDERLGQLKILKGRILCSTVDGFALQLVRRWVSLAAALGYDNVDPQSYDLVCDVAGALLRVKDVCRWVAATYPILVIDEAQDLTENRLSIVQGLATCLDVLAAADEFQCLNEDLRPNPACDWIARASTAMELSQPRRTDVSELLEAAAEIRAGRPPKSNKLFKIQLTPKPPLAGSWLSNSLNWYGGGKSVAIITPSLAQFARETVDWTAKNRTSKGAGPYTIRWEESESRASANFIAKLALPDHNDIPSTIANLTAADDHRAARDLAEWMDTQRRTRGQTTFSKAEVELAIGQGFARRRRTLNNDQNGWHGMTVHGAKNREFDNVVLLWPAAVAGSDEQKRRLLYNAVTRAKERCLVLVQATKDLHLAPFA